VNITWPSSVVVLGFGYPDAIDPSLVGTYSPLAKAGGGYVWDEVLEYRVWLHPERGAPDEEEGSDYFHAFATYAEAAAFSEKTPGAKEPLALIRKIEHIHESEPGAYTHVKELRIAEWIAPHNQPLSATRFRSWIATTHPEPCS
jgi:hypothetical protein